MTTILHLESSLGWGGQENRTLHECVGLKRLGARVLLLCRPESKLGVKAEEAGVEVVRRRMNSNRDLSAVLYAMKLIKREAVDLVVTHSGDDSLIGAVAGRLSSRKPAIVRTRHIALPITSKMTYSLLPHRVVTVSEHVRGYLVNDKGLPADKVKAIPTGIDLSRFDPGNAPDTLRAELEAGPDTPIAGTVAILRMKKGHHVLLDAIPKVLAQVPSALFVFAGDGPQRNNISAKVKALGLEKNVVLLGLRSDVPAILNGIDVFVLPTLQEALGTSVLEASAMGKPVVAARVGGVPEAVRNNETGILVEPLDPDGLAGAIIRLFKDKNLSASMGQKGRKMVEREYSLEVMVKSLHDFYDKLLRYRKGGVLR